MSISSEHFASEAYKVIERLRRVPIGQRRLTSFASTYDPSLPETSVTNVAYFSLAFLSRWVSQLDGMSDASQEGASWIQTNLGVGKAPSTNTVSATIPLSFWNERSWDDVIGLASNMATISGTTSSAVLSATELHLNKPARHRPQIPTGSVPSPFPKHVLTELQDKGDTPSHPLGPHPISITAESDPISTDRTTPTDCEDFEVPGVGRRSQTDSYNPSLNQLDIHPPSESEPPDAFGDDFDYGSEAGGDPPDSIESSHPVPDRQIELEQDPPNHNSNLDDPQTAGCDEPSSPLLKYDNDKDQDSILITNARPCYRCAQKLIDCQNKDAPSSESSRNPKPRSCIACARASKRCSIRDPAWYANGDSFWRTWDDVTRLAVALRVSDDELDFTPEHLLHLLRKDLMSFLVLNRGLIYFATRSQLASANKMMEASGLPKLKP